MPGPDSRTTRSRRRSRRVDRRAVVLWVAGGLLILLGVAQRLFRSPPPLVDPPEPAVSSSPRLAPLSEADRPEPSEIDSLPLTRATGACPSSPPEGLWRQRATDLPVHPRSEAWMATLAQGPDLRLDPSYRVTELRQAIAPVSLSIRSPANSDDVPWFIPPEARAFQPLNTRRGTRLVVVDHLHCRSYELFDVQASGQGWTTSTANAFDLQTVRRRRTGWQRESEGTGLLEALHDASGASVIAGLLRRDELLSGEPIEHALSVSVLKLDRAYLPPANHGASDVTNPDAPPSGARLRLRAEVDCGALAEEGAPARAVCDALKRYGMIITTQGPTFAIATEALDRSLLESLQPLSTLSPEDFDIVGSEEPIRYGSTALRFRGEDR